MSAMKILSRSGDQVVQEFSLGFCVCVWGGLFIPLKVEGIQEAKAEGSLPVPSQPVFQCETLSQIETQKRYWEIWLCLFSEVENGDT